MKWIVEELADHWSDLFPLANVDDIVAHLGRGDAGMLVIDFDALTDAQLVDLGVLGRQAFQGTLIALGSVPPEVEEALEIDHVMQRPLGSEVLRKTVEDLR